ARRRRPVTTLSVPPEAAGQRLDRFLADHVGSRAAAERAVEGGVLVDGHARPKSYRLAGGELLELPEADAPAASAPPPPLPRIAFEDEHLLIVDKPAGL